MTTSYRLEAIDKLRAHKKEVRELERMAFAAEEKRKADRDAANEARIAAKLGRATGEEPAPPSVVLSDVEQEALIEEPAIKPKRRRKAAPKKKEAQDAAEEGTWPGDDLGEHQDAP
jgi:hypothetical protein